MMQATLGMIILRYSESFRAFRLIFSPILQRPSQRQLALAASTFGFKALAVELADDAVAMFTLDFNLSVFDCAARAA